MENAISVSTVLVQLPRIRTLHIDMEMDVEARRQVEDLIVKSPAPRLEELDITGVDSASITSLADNMLEGSTPLSLRDLQLAQCAISLRCPLLQATTLVSVHLENCKVWGSVEQVLESLSLWPRLETFVWTWPDPVFAELDDPFVNTFAMPDVPTSEWRGERLSLPHLKTLDLRHEALALFTVFSRLTPPPSCDITLSALVNTIHTEADEDNMRTTLDHTLGAYLARVFSSGTGFATMAVETPRDFEAPSYESFPGLSVTWTSPTASSAPSTLKVVLDRLEDSPRCKELTLLEHMMRWPQASSFLERFELGRSDFLYEGDIGRNRAKPDVAWKRLLVLLKSIEHLCVRKDEGLSWLFQVLQAERTIVPRLKSLYLEETHVEELANLVALAKWRLNDCSLHPLVITMKKCTIDFGEEVPQLKIDMNP